MEKKSPNIKEETRDAAISAIQDGATRNNADKLRPILEVIKKLNLEIEEQWEMLNRFADKVVKFKKSKDTKDLD